MGLVLIDTSIWIAHLRSPHEKLIKALSHGIAAVHSAVIGELACGTLKHRKEFLEGIARLRSVIEAENEEVLQFIEQHKMYGKGIGWVDAQLLASCLLSNAQILTLDKKLNAVASKLL